MNNSSQFLEVASEQLGLGLTITNDDESKYLFKIRFADLEGTQSFGLGVNRKWRSTEVELVPDGFGAEYLQFLAGAALSHRAQLLQLIIGSGEDGSEISIQVDGQDLHEANFEYGYVPKKLAINAYILSSESSLKDRLINEREQDLFLTTLKVLAYLLPKSLRKIGFAEEVIGYPEGASVSVFVNKYERDQRNRRMAILMHGKSCLACGFDFGKAYGELGSDFAIIHHVTPVSEIGPDYIVDVEKDLIPVCGNCHAMIHREDPPLSLDSLKKIINHLG